MSEISWKEILGWTDEQLDELRFAGYSYFREGHYETAVSFFEALIVINPSYVYDLQALGGIYLQMNASEKALKILNDALALDPAHEPTLLNKVKALIALDQKSEALNLAQLLKKSPVSRIADDATALIMAYS